MPLHRVQPGECLSTIAARYGVAGWKALLEDPNNARLQNSRPNPNILLPGDEVFVPDPGELEQVECATGRKHRFRVERPLVGLRVVLRDTRGNAFAGKKFVLVVGDREIEGLTKEDGLVEADVPLEAKSATLRAWLYEEEDPEDPDIEYELQIGYLDPVESISGIQGRLRNLGFRVPLDGELGEETVRAIRRFRDKYDVTPEGEDLIDDNLRTVLCEKHAGA